MRRLKVQLIALLVLAVVLPAVPIAFTTHSLIRRSLDPVLGAGVEDGARAGLEAVREILEHEKRAFEAGIETGDATRLAPDALAALDSAEREHLGTRAAEAEKTSANGSAGGEAEDDAVGDRQVLIPPERATVAGREALVALVEAPGGDPVWMIRPLPPELAARAAKLADSVRLLEGLRREREPVTRSLIATFLVVYGLVVVLVLGLGLYLASRITRPMTALGRGIDRVAEGDLAARVGPVGGGEARQLIAHFNDMAGRLGHQQAELVRLEKLAAWRQMARRLAHEIKNPLTPIQLAAQQMRDEYRGDDGDYRRLVNEAAAIVEEEVEGLRHLVSEFSRFARLPEPRPEDVDPRELLADIAALYGEDKVSIEPPSEPAARIRCDRDQIHRALINLVENALAAQEETGTPEAVVVTARIDPRGARLEVLDRGPGVPPADRRRIFEPDVTGKRDGMGLGLAIVEATARAHGGSVEVSDRRGSGAAFTLVLPAQPGTATETGNPAPATFSAPGDQTGDTA